MTKYAYRVRETYKGVLLDVRAHNEEDLQAKLQYKRQCIDIERNEYVATTSPSNLVGDLGEAVAVAEFMKMGFVVSKPFTLSSKYDLIVDYDGHLYKVQCKTIKQTGENGAMNFKLRASNKCDGEWSSITYDKKDVDLFFLYCVENNWCGLYFMPQNAPHLTALTIYEQKPKGSRGTSLTTSQLDFRKQARVLCGHSENVIARS